MAPSTSTASASSPGSSSDQSLPRRKQRVSAEHTLNRVRENQRRHRARQRDHVASLELQLAEAERQLAAARAEIEALKAERDTANAFVCYDITKHFERVDSVVATTSTFASPLELSESMAPPALAETSGSIEPTLIATSFQLRIPSIPTSGPPPCCMDTLPPAATTGLDLELEPAALVDGPECSTCKTKPLPSPSESTTLCAQAFIMISQQNVRNLDPELIRLWLSQGYRRAVREGEGCRVENGTLKGLLEYISVVEDAQ
ncbi:hypothetical protein E8E13_008479 [Curvularia kusanoi]|uniref:BZIP domain-containing protein n=1 Tax=Curvularia kusanoi TaxID=90978 RepID=A0A9P4TFR0_CURKU|nr:hypothetical protein E8E13_008479 [Curvularia kusanoi]